jgi:hypothetical protein
MNARATILLILCGGGLALAGCSSTEAPVAGVLEVRLASPNPDDRAVLLRLAGKQSAVTAPSGSSYRVLAAPGLGDTVKLLVIAPQGAHLAAGALVRVTVPDVRQAGSYSARLLDVASTAYAKRPTTGYVLAVVKP